MLFEVKRLDLKKIYDTMERNNIHMGEALQPPQNQPAGDEKITQALFHLNEGYEEGTIEQNLANLAAKTLPEKRNEYEAIDKDDKQTLAVLASLTDEELALIKANHKRITRTTGIHDLYNHLNTLHQLTGNPRYKLD